MHILSGCACLSVGVCFTCKTKYAIRIRQFFGIALYLYKALSIASKEKIRFNEHILAAELRVVTFDGENLGVLSREDALRKAKEMGLDLIEISPNANPPVAKIIDYGKFHYDLKKKAKTVQEKAHITETKTIQVKIGTGEHDLALKARRASEWLKQGDRIKLDLFLPGRSKYMELNFLKERMERMLKLITEQYKIADPAKKSPKGLTIVIERSNAK